MDTLAAYAMGQAHKDDPRRVFDWNKATEIIREKNPRVAEAGLIEDWGYTGGAIYTYGAIVPECNVYLASRWATPTLVLDGKPIECFLMEHEVPVEWGNEYPNIYWPQSALDILGVEA